MRGKVTRGWIAFGIAIVIATASAHAPLRWLYGVAGEYHAHVDPTEVVGERWINTTVEGPEIEGTLFAWRRDGGERFDEEARELIADIDRLMPVVGARRTFAGVEVLGASLTQAPSRVFAPFVRTINFATEPVRTSALLIGSGVNSNPPEVGHLNRYAMALGLPEAGSNSDTSLRLGSPYTSGVGSGLTPHAPPLIDPANGGGGVGGGSTPPIGGGGIPSVGSSLPEPSMAGTLLAMLAFTLRRRTNRK